MGRLVVFSLYYLFVVGVVVLWVVVCCLYVCSRLFWHSLSMNSLFSVKGENSCEVDSGNGTNELSWFGPFFFFVSLYFSSDKYWYLVLEFFWKAHIHFKKFDIQQLTFEVDGKFYREREREVQMNSSRWLLINTADKENKNIRKRNLKRWKYVDFTCPKNCLISDKGYATKKNKFWKWLLSWIPMYLRVISSTKLLRTCNWWTRHVDTMLLQ